MRYFLISLLFCLTNHLKADVGSYNDTLRLITESENYMVIHYHDWTNKTRDSRYQMISGNQDPFDKNNDYAYIICFDKRSKKILFKKPCPAFTKIQISDDEKYIIGISKIMLWNPYQLAIFDTKGELIKKRNFSSEEARMTKEQFDTFNIKFPKQHLFLDSLNRIYKVGDLFFIDFSSMGMPDKLDKAWDFLSNYVSKNHISNNVGESVTNWIYWYYEKNPDIKFEYKDNVLNSISILDTKQQRVYINIKE